VVAGWRSLSLEVRIWVRLARLAVQRLGFLGAWAGIRSFAAAARGARGGWRMRRFARVKGSYAWDLHAPAFPSAAFDAFAADELARAVGQRGGPHLAVVAMTRRCGLRCAHCLEAESGGLPESLTCEELAHVVKKLRSAGIVQILFSGGEPLERFPDLIELIEAAGEDVQCWVMSSCVGLDRERGRRLRDAGACGVALSLDHWDPARHDAFRGRAGTFQGVVRAARYVREAGLTLALGVCPTRELATAEDLETYRRVAVGLGASFIQIVEPVALGRWRGQDVALGPHERATLEAFHERLCFGREPNPIVAYPELVARRIGCQGAGLRFLYVDSAGAAHACPFCRESAGSLLKADAREVIDCLSERGCPDPRRSL
jgi:MoaA/NifB/PqqE/SkfB family radical SAM enzyme